WIDNGAAPSGAVFARRFDAAGTALGSQFQVDTAAPGVEQIANVSVAGNAAGEFVVAWVSVTDGSTGAQQLFARRYDATGAALGMPFHVSDQPFSFRNNASVPAVAADAAGDFVVTWNAAPTQGADEAVFARVYNAAGVAQTDVFQVNTTEPTLTGPAVAIDA